MRNLTNRQAAKILDDIKVKIEIPKAAVTQRERNTALDMAIELLKCSEFPNSSDTISRQMAIDALKAKAVPLYKDLGCNDIWERDRTLDNAIDVIRGLPSAQPKWNNHTVACLLAELFDDTCACNFNGIDEWLPEKCEVIDSCPNPVGVACWEQFLKHRTERKEDDN